MSPKSFFTAVGRCARCDKDHKRIKFKKFKRPAGNKSEYSHWGMCPVMHEPLLLWIVEKEIVEIPRKKRK